MELLKHCFLETKLTNWEDIFKLPQQFMDKFVFRGQGDSEWNLSTSLERSIGKFYPYNTDTSLYFTEEKYLLKAFKWKYPLYSTSLPDKDDLIEWLTIMQHYGAPTRLVDITRSLFVAVYFALADAASAHSAVWAINGSILNHKFFNKYVANLTAQSLSQDQLDELALNEANNILGRACLDDKIETDLLLIKPRLANERISRQQGAFLFPANIQKTFLEHLKSHVSNEQPLNVPFKELIKYSQENKSRQDDITILKIIIPNDLNYEVGKYLRQMNVTAEILFPGLDGLCKSLSYLRYRGMGNSFKM